MDTTAEKLVKSMEELSAMFCSRMGEFEKNLPQASTNASNQTLKALASEFSTFKTFVWKSLGILKSQMELLVCGFDRLETLSRRKSLLFHGIKEENSEDVMKKTLKVLSDQLKIPDVLPTAIESCHRLGTKKDANRPILVRFSSMQLRSSAWRAKTSLKGSKITITEFLTKSRQDVFLAARNHFGMKKCWSADGVIVIILQDKSRVKITSSSELKDLIKKHPKSASAK